MTQKRALPISQSAKTQDSLVMCFAENYLALTARARGKKYREKCKEKGKKVHGGEAIETLQT